MKHVLTIAGSDSGGGAGIQADLKTFSALGVYGMSVITAITAQNTLGVQAVEDVSPELVEAQLTSIFSDIRVDAVKIGMVSNQETIQVIARQLEKYPLPIVLDPVMVAKGGHALLQPNAEQALLEQLLPLATLVTPNIPEIERMIGGTVHSLADMKQAAVKLIERQTGAVLLKGGHLEGQDATDLLYTDERYVVFEQERIESRHTHGTGCTLSAAIAANLALGHSLEDSVRYAKRYVTEAIRHGFALGHGIGPTHHFHELWRDTHATTHP
ncbi:MULTISPECIES: bifunctional hydroxymethylpyrimidine kinase/phosphomethylpyrimidine kinase [Exiguobacterium]|uniref:bifunctional hydroxymethylpyrimidine kinase/phosphomethylpyrimidine kinase n=1 Tax=Exiguobacterium TaxID=33986 RepID=UPI001BE8764A|nr:MULTISPECIES: bifunctional hydroxymethylpyrimidine kinase/phosphomethylpyrimidine kinase [Exiguobacterium]MCT4792560.1 bifunctional hydroxymethylpyrimidine kinase/phosphomethylpyrimidine kinase [Exiguobacterium artemiae]